MGNVELKGLPRLLRQFAYLKARVPPAVGRGLYRGAEMVMTVSKRDYVPVDLGALRASGHVDQPVVEGSKVRVVLGFGDDTVDYAVYVHEDLTARHTVGQAKYLEVPLKEMIPQIVEQVRVEFDAVARDTGHA